MHQACLVLILLPMLLRHLQPNQGREDRSLVRRSDSGACSLPGQWRSGLAFVPIAFYNGRRGFIRGTVLQLLFYGAYPAHLLLLFFIKRSMGGY